MDKQLDSMRTICIEFTRKKIRETIKEDTYIIQLISHIEDLDKIINMMVKRLRDWYELYLPEISIKVPEHESFLMEIRRSKKELMQKYKIKESMGQNFSIRAIDNLRRETDNLYNLREKQLDELDKEMEKHYPNTTMLAGSLIGSKLISLAGSMKNLIEFPASTVQILGAEKALFRHIKTGARPPKYGILLSHPYVAKARDKAKAARKIADKISIAAKVDYFKGEFVGDKLKAMLK